MTDLPHHLSGELSEAGHRLVQRVYYEDTDFSGVVYHARYLHFMERGRTDYLRLLGVEQGSLVLEEDREGLVFVLWGASAKEKGRFIDRERHLVLSAPHPSPYSAASGFFGSKPFSAINRWLAQRGEAPIDWSLE